MNDYNLFIKTLKTYHNRCIELDLPINILMPILVNIDFFLDKLNYQEIDIDKRLKLLCEQIEKISGRTGDLKIFIMYSIVKYIEDRHDYFTIHYREDVIKASSKSAEDIEENTQDEYWLTAWQPSRIASNPQLYIEQVMLSKKIWLEESEVLRNILYVMVFQPPFGLGKSWSILREIV